MLNAYRAAAAEVFPSEQVHYEYFSVTVDAAAAAT